MAKRKSKTKHPKLPNGFGRITEIKGRNLRKPFRAMVTVGKNEEGRPIGKILGYYESWYAAYDALAEYKKNPFDLSEKSTTIGELYQKWSSEYCKEVKSATTVRSVRSIWEYVPQEIRSKRVSEMTPQAIKDFIMNQTRKIDGSKNVIVASDGIKSRIKSMFNMMYDYAILAGIVDRNPCRLFTLKGLSSKIESKRKEKIPFTPEQVEELWNDKDFGYTKMILINIYSGWRPDEMLELKKENIDLANKTMMGGKKTAAGTNRIIPIHSRILPLIEYYYNLSDGEMLLYDYDNGPKNKLNYDKYKNRFRNVMVHHAWEGIFVPSCPRHTFSTLAKEYGMEEYARKKIMGHDMNDVTDKHYTHLDIDYLSKEIEKIR